MKRPRPTLLSAALTVAAVALCVFPAPVTAQDGPDFLFRKPRATLGLRVGYDAPRAQSGLFDFTREQLTVERSDFSSAAVQGEVGLWVHDQLDVVVGLGWANSRTRSEFRGFEGTDDLPIEQTTRFTRVPLTLGVRGFPLERGRSIGSFTWVPARWSPYVGAGGGGMWYAFEQQGEFVDYDTLDIFADTFLSDGWAPTAYALAGVEVMLRPRVMLGVEGRYQWGSAGLDRDFVDFDDLDLAGLRATVGVSFRF